MEIIKNFDASNLILMITFVIPGFVMLKTYHMLMPGREKDSSKQVIDAFAYSCINYALLSFPILWVEAKDYALTHPYYYFLFYAAVLLVAPVFWAYLYNLIRHSNHALAVLPHPVAKPWDFVFGQRDPYWVIVTLADGVRIGGLYGTKPFSSSFPELEQIYLEETWLLNEEGGFDRVRTDSAGIIITATDIKSVELFEVTSGVADDE